MSTTTTSINTLIDRRERAMDRADRALDKAWPERKGDAYVNEMTSVAKELESIASQMREARANNIEQSRAYRYLGSVYTDLEPAMGKKMLTKAVEAYSQAEALLEGQHNELEQAKLDFNLGNALRQLDANNVQQLQEARSRFERARAIMSRSAPQYLAQIDTALTSVDNLLAIAPLAATVNENISESDKLSKALEQGGDVTEIAKQFEDLQKREGGAAALVGKLQTLVDTLPEDVRQSDKYDEVKQQLGAVAKMALGGDKTDSQEALILKALSERLGADLQAGKVDPQRAKNLEGLLGDLGGVLGGDDSDLSAMMDKLQKLRSKYEDRIEILHYLSHGIARPPEGSRAAALVERCWLLRRFLAEDMSRPNKKSEESKRGLDLNVRASQTDKQIYETGSDDKRAQSVDIDVLRPLTLEIREFAARYQSMLVQPLWGSARVTIDNEAVFYSGASDLRQRLDRACQSLSLNVMPSPKGESFAKARWKQLRKAAVTVFDMRRPTDAASVAYEMGIALALCKSIVIIGSEDEELPFDIDIEPVLLQGGRQGGQELKNALDQALAWLPQPGNPNALVKTVDQVLATYSIPHPDTYIDQTLKLLTRQREDMDSVAINNSLKTLVSYLNDHKTLRIQPHWSPEYPLSGDRRLFHVTPFREEFDLPTEVTRHACNSNECQYVRGDEVQDPDVIQSIWSELNRASHVLVDLTGMNSNVTLELGIAHTVGKPVLMVKQGAKVSGLFPMIAKLRVYPYKQAEQLGDQVSRFVRLS